MKQSLLKPLNFLIIIKFNLLNDSSMTSVFVVQSYTLTGPKMCVVFFFMGQLLLGIHVCYLTV